MIESQRVEDEAADQEVAEMEANCPLMEPQVWASPVAESDYENDSEDDTEPENSGPTYISLQTVSSSRLTSSNVLQNKDTNSQTYSDISCAKCTKRRRADCYESDAE